MERSIQASPPVRTPVPARGRLFVLAGSCLVLSACGSTAWTEPDPAPAVVAPGPVVAPADHRHDGFYSRDGLQVGVRAHKAHLGGEFDGDLTLVGPADTIEVPDADGGHGLGVSLGVLSEGVGLEVAYTRTDYEGTIGNANADVDYQDLSLNLLYYTRANLRIQPYGIVGASFPWATLENASTDGVVVGDAELSQGFGLNLGLGVAWFLSRDVFLDLRGQSTLAWFDEAEGVADLESDVDGWVYAPNHSLSFGVTWIAGGFD